MGKASLSGASTALSYNSLAVAGRSGDFERVLGRNSLSQHLSAAIVALAGGIVASRHSLISTYQLSLMSMACSLLIAFSLVEPQRQATAGKSPILLYVKKAYLFLWGCKDVLRILFHGIVMAAVTIYVDEFWQVYLKETGIAIAYFGVSSVAESLAGGAGAFFAYKFRHCVVDHILLALLLIWAGAAFAAAGSRSPWGIAFPLLVYLVSGMAEP